MPAFALGGQSKLAASKLTMGEPADDVLESLKGMSMMDAVALQKEIDRTLKRSHTPKARQWLWRTPTNRVVDSSGPPMQSSAI